MTTPGRLTLLEFRGARLVVDFAHNPDGWLALARATRTIPAQRRIVVIGQGGDRDDQALDELAAAVWQDRPEVIVLKEMPKYLRGRPAGEVTARLAHAFAQLGVPATSIRHADNELTAIEIALDESRPGDLLLLSVHEDYAARDAPPRGVGGDPVQRLVGDDGGGFFRGTGVALTAESAAAAARAAAARRPCS